MNGFTVDCGELQEGVSELRAVRSAFPGSDSLGWLVTPEQVGHGTLEAALGTFQDMSRRAIAVLKDDMADGANRLDNSAAAYQAADAAIMDTIAQIPDSTPVSHGLTETQITAHHSGGPTLVDRLNGIDVLPGAPDEAVPPPVTRA